MEETKYYLVKVKEKFVDVETGKVKTNYMDNSVGVGEHPQQVEEAMKALEKLTESKDKVSTLDEYFKDMKFNKINL